MMKTTDEIMAKIQRFNCHNWVTELADIRKDIDELQNEINVRDDALELMHIYNGRTPAESIKIARDALEDANAKA